MIMLSPIRCLVWSSIEKPSDSSTDAVSILYDLLYMQYHNRYSPVNLYKNTLVTNISAGSLGGIAGNRVVENTITSYTLDPAVVPLKIRK